MKFSLRDDTYITSALEEEKVLKKQEKGMEVA